MFNNRRIIMNPKKIFSKNTNIFIIDKNNKIIVGNLDNQLLFIPKYIFSYIYEFKLKSERNNFNNMSIEEYIESRNCKIDYYDIQTLVVNRSKIGELKILNYNSKKEDKNNELQYNKIKYETQDKLENSL